jgi:hypothetical protein
MLQPLNYVKKTVKIREKISFPQIAMVAIAVAVGGGILSQRKLKPSNAGSINNRVMVNEFGRQWRVRTNAQRQWDPEKRSAELAWSRSVLHPKSGNPKVFFDEFTFEHGLFHVVNDVQYDSPKRIGTIFTRVWNKSNSTISHCRFTFDCFKETSNSVHPRTHTAFTEFMNSSRRLEIAKNVSIPPNSKRSVKLTFELPVETLEGNSSHLVDKLHWNPSADEFIKSNLFDPTKKLGLLFVFRGEEAHKYWRFPHVIDGNLSLHH